MIVTQSYGTRADGVKLYRIYSDTGYKIKQLPTNIIYDSAIDIEGSSYTYEETTTKTGTTVDNDGPRLAGVIIDSFSTSQDKHNNAPSLSAVEGLLGEYGGRAGDTLPIGSIVPYGGTAAPTG